MRKVRYYLTFSDCDLISSVYLLSMRIFSAFVIVVPKATKERFWRVSPQQNLHFKPIYI